MLESLSLQLYQLQQWGDRLVDQQLTHWSVLSIFLVFGAGLLTSLTPCTLSMLPITIGYIGGAEEKTRSQTIFQSLWFTVGLATTLAALGIVAAGFGQIYGQIGIGLPIVVSAIAIVMGLNLLEIIQIQFPSIGATDWITNDLPQGVRAYLVGLTFGLVASPCSTPVLATLLAWVSTTHDLVLGGGLLLAYTLGYVMPVLIAGIFTASLKKLLSLRQWSGWINPVSGALLVGFGIFSLLIRLPIGLS
ncbi:cytochrome c biogenesis protein transmembrane region [[Leptolyngbya] sp. PCC 7376]|uniref:cytochrome c biogenesis protein CcdA n=1 Tax=[Leptolyngbya] sp. PCC 7376 TaxID=111781 RepID=UPI00029ED627|nr:cytochrome c biogenesis protein CcdA [[Leptolyngbya] sp. PCC 7376]AFY40682.1 cytochrome c biogenesis protein transmembrane region [[Leptolyngbya] sp. PCC 7376]